MSKKKKNNVDYKRKKKEKICDFGLGIITAK